MAKKLGIYFGKNKISVVEVQGTRIIQRFTSNIIGLDSEVQTETTEVMFDEIKQADAIRSALTYNKISTKNAYVGLSNRNLFIRGFQMPILNRDEIASGVRFEAKKYLPFKTEDLLFDFQHRKNKQVAKLEIIFTATTQTNLDKYLDILKQQGMRIRVVEPASFSLVRILSRTKQWSPQLSCALITVQDSDVEFSIISAGFPCFSRDIKLPLQGGGASIPEEDSLTARLASEIRVSLDYFRRHFSGRIVDKVFILTKDIQENLVSSLQTNLGLPVEQVDLARDQELSSIADLDILRAYSLALKNSSNFKLSIDLSTKKHREVTVRAEEASGKWSVFRVDIVLQPLLMALALFSLAYVMPREELVAVTKRLEALKADAQETLKPDYKELSVGSLQNKKIELEEKIATIENLINSRSYLTPAMNFLPAAVKSGLWIEELNITSKGTSRTIFIKGAVFLDNESKELKMVNEFWNNLKVSKEFMRNFNVLVLKSMNRTKKEGYDFTAFEIEGK